MNFKEYLLNESTKGKFKIVTKWNKYFIQNESGNLYSRTKPGSKWQYLNPKEKNPENKWVDRKSDSGLNDMLDKFAKENHYSHTGEFHESLDEAFMILDDDGRAFDGKGGFVSYKFGKKYKTIEQAHADSRKAEKAADYEYFYIEDGNGKTVWTSND